MGIFVWLIGVVVAAVVSYFVDILIGILRRGLSNKWRIFVLAIVFVLSFMAVVLVASPKARDIARAILTGERCYFSSITAPDGALKEIDAQAYPVSLDTPITWEPNNCVMVVQSYQHHVLQNELKGQRSNKIIVNDVTYNGTTEIKIFREGFYTESDKIWVEVELP